VEIGNDVDLDFQGTLVLFRLNTPAARAWVAENVEAESYQWFGSRLAVERRYAWDLVCGLRGAGLRVW
jgi:hypothetical protein